MITEEEAKDEGLLCCFGCHWLERLDDQLPHDLSGYLCKQPAWGGYVDPTLPACLGSRDGRRFLIAFFPTKDLRL